MTQHLTIMSDKEVQPQLGQLWRDDQVLMWGLAPGWKWDKNHEPPIEFLPPDDTYDAWPGSTPTPVGDPPPSGTPDRRFYVAMALKVMDSGSEKYHWQAWILPEAADESEEGRRVRATRYNTETCLLEPVDPDVENQPQP